MVVSEGAMTRTDAQFFPASFELFVLLRSAPPSLVGSPRGELGAHSDGRFKCKLLLNQARFRRWTNKLVGF